jgi:hypothetical protein
MAESMSDMDFDQAIKHLRKLHGFTPLSAEEAERALAEAEPVPMSKEDIDQIVAEIVGDKEREETQRFRVVRAARSVVDSYPLGDPAQSTDKCVMVAVDYLRQNAETRELRLAYETLAHDTNIVIQRLKNELATLRDSAN